MLEDQEVIREFLVESHENLSRLDQDLVELEKRPKDAALLASIFRTIHTIKGTCGFFAFSTLEKISHQAENLLSQLRDGQRELDPCLVSLILETVDATRRVLASIEACGEEGPEKFEDLAERLRVAAQSGGALEARVAMAKKPEAPAEADGGAEPAAEPAKEVKAEAKCDDDGTRSSAVADANIRVGVVLLDKLMDLVGELVLTRNQILQFNTQREDAELNATSQRLNLITTELQEGVMKTRMQPIGMVWNKLPRVVRDMALALGKQVRLEMDGAETELDRTIIEAIKDPLVHLVRNSCDHGIEPPDVRQRAGKAPQGKLTLRAYHEGGQVNIEIGDDGAGVDVARVRQKAIEKGLLQPELAQKMSDREVLNLIFQPGFSTAQTVTNVSGRGVGMDVVKSNIEKIGGIVDISSRLGQGTTVKLKIPLTLAIIPGLVITSGEERFVIPQVSLLELIRLEGDSREKHIEYVHGTPVLRRRGALLPIAYLNNVLRLKSGAASDVVSIVVLQAEDRQFGLVVDGINDTQEIVVKPLGKQLKGMSVYAGATIMGDGRVALILDVLGIGERSGVLAQSQEQLRGAATQAAHADAEEQSLLLFRVGRFERIAVPLSLVARLEEFPAAQIEHAGGAQVVQYRNRILPLVHLGTLLGSGAEAEARIADPAQVIVFRDGDRSLGVVVDQILDIAEEAIAVRQRSSHNGLLGSAVVGKHVADFLDLDYVFAASAAAWSQSSSGDHGKTVLVADSSAFMRAMVRNRLEMAGYRVMDAGSAEESIRRLERQAVDTIVASSAILEGESGLRALLRQRSDWQGLRVIELGEICGANAGVETATAPKLNAEQLLDVLARLPEPAGAALCA